MEELEFIDISRPEERAGTTGRRKAEAAAARKAVNRNNTRAGNRREDGRATFQEEPKNRSQNRRRATAQRKTDASGAIPDDERERRKEIERRRQMLLRKKRRMRKRSLIRGAIILCELGFIVVLCFLIYHLIRSFGTEQETAQVFSEKRAEVIKENDAGRPDIIEDFLTVNEYSRPGEPLEKVNNIFVHYTANQGTSAAQNRSYFENLGITGETSASAHFVIGYDGEIIQCIPLDEIGYAVMQRNYDSISIECCYLAEDGKFTDATYQSLIRLSAWLLKEYKLAPEDMRRHYDEGGKKCPLYYVEHEDAWEQFLTDLEAYIMGEQV